MDIGVFDEFNVSSSTLSDFFESEAQVALRVAAYTLPDACVDCSWKNLCRGSAGTGRLVNRYSKKSGFNNPSIICSALQDFYSHVAAYLLRVGLSFDQLQTSLINDIVPLAAYDAPCPFKQDGKFGNKKLRKNIPIFLAK